MRYEVAAAFTIGMLLPVLETVRRGFGHWAIATTTMLEDYLAGALLLLTGFAAARRVAFAKPLLLADCAGVSTMMTLSFIGQIEAAARAPALEPNITVVLAFKFLLWTACVVALFRSFRLVWQGPA